MTASSGVAEQVELEAVRDFFLAAPEGVAAELRTAGRAVAVRVRELPTATELNRVLRLSTIEELDELEPLYEGGWFAVALDPGSGLGDSLETRGFVPGYAWQKFARAAGRLDARTELSVEPPRSADDFGDTFARGYGLPDFAAPWAASVVGRHAWHCFVAYDGDRPAGVGALFAHGGDGWLGFGATLPEKRGRGAQSALLAARVNRAEELGLRTLVTETGVPREDGPGPSYRNILRAGFREAYVRPNYVRPIPG